MIDFGLIAWDDEDNPRSNVQHIAANGLTIEEVEQILHDPANRPTISRFRLWRSERCDSSACGSPCGG